MFEVLAALLLVEEFAQVEETVRIFDTERMALPPVRFVHDPFKFRFTLEGVNPRIVKETSRLAFATDAKGGRYSAHADFEPNAKNSISISAMGVPADAHIERLTLRIPRRVVQVEIPFAFRNVPVN